MYTSDSTISEVEATSDIVVAAAFAATRPGFIMMTFVILFYGAYTIIFSLYGYLQAQQHGRNRYYQITVMFLYMLATTALVLAILEYNQENLLLFSVVFNNAIGGAFFDPVVQAHFSAFESIDIAEAAVYVTANIIADALLLYRCYVVWGARKYIILGPFLISLTNTALGLAAAVLEQKSSDRILIAVAANLGENASLKAVSAISTSFLAVNLVTNIVLTGLIAGRIWWISQETRRSLPGVGGKNLNSIVAMILESGSLYPVALAICLGLNKANTEASIEPVLTVIVGMAPTLIMVRADLGISVQINSDEKDLELHESRILSPYPRF
ncbi:hypothetical protein BDP27DRAFT_1426363 [Rhodocollybia butyracea]|uniref:Uncharacterized protein n=1 Tax=Rhodocollybia butyracea TaxID=206335 RepID=A0A9P5PIP2_9AGAR|nr:hypothetical protein BDP27DRAFT_1426363 [Rhodocollybia butyracea]